MKTLDQVIQAFKSECVDDRDTVRLCRFVPENRLADIGLQLNDDQTGKHEVMEFNKENVLKQLREDIAFGIEKAKNQRGISSGLMHDVVMMWNDILEDGLEGNDEYSNPREAYGMPLFRLTAEKYGWKDLLDGE